MVFPADTRPVKALIACLKDNEMSVREASASALRNTGLGDRESPEPVVQALKDSEWQVRAAAVRLLGGFCYRPEVQRAILGVLQDANEREEVRLAAIDALVCPDRLEILRQVWRDTRMPARLRDAAWWRLREVYQFMAPPRRADGHPPA
jgi:HEAT repeat protein